MQRTVRLLAILVAIGCSAPRDAAHADTQATPIPVREALRPEALGCWQLLDRFGPLSTGAYWAPAYVRLDSTPVGVAGEAGARLALRFGKQWEALPLYLEPGINGMNSWRADRDTDSIRILFSNLFSGSEFVLALPAQVSIGEIIAGEHVQFSDDMQNAFRRLGKARARRVECSGAALQPH